jgi:hypothetical protein
MRSWLIRKKRVIQPLPVLWIQNVPCLVRELRQAFEIPRDMRRVPSAGTERSEHAESYGAVGGNEAGWISRLLRKILSRLFVCRIFVQVLCFAPPTTSSDIPRPAVSPSSVSFRLLGSSLMGT